MNKKLWNWRNKEWPNFTWDIFEINKLEQEFLYKSGKLIGSHLRFTDSEKIELAIEIMENESQTIQNNKKDYYNSLEMSSKNCDLTGWISYFARIILEAQNDTIQLLNFIISKTKFYDQYKNQLNPRQNKVVSRIFKKGIKGFKGGLGAKDYISITQTTSSTATRDLQDLVRKEVLKKTGDKKSTRYYLNFAL